MGILLGYSDVGYRVLIKNKIIVVRHVDIVEENVKYIGFDEVESKYSSPSTSTLESSRGEENDRDDDLSDNVFESADEYEEQLSKEKEKNNSSLHQPSGRCKDTQNETLKVPRKSTRDRKSPVRYPERESYNIYVRYCRVDTHCTFEEAMNSKENKNWHEAMNKEIECINKYMTWKLVERVKDKKILDVKWVYTRKSDNRYKARLVVRGFQKQM